MAQGGRRYIKRSAVQRGRVKQGVNSGSIGKREQHSLKRSAQRSQNMRQRFASDGEIKAREKMRLKQNMNHRSRKIKRFKDN